MRRYRIITLVVAIVTGFSLIASVAFAGQKRELRWADNIFNNRQADYYGWNRMMDLIEERTDGQITFKRLSKGVAGNVAQVTEAMQRGTLDIGVTFATILGLHSKAAGALVLPFLFNLPEDQIWNIMSPETRQLLDVVEKEAGLKILTTGIYEERSFITKKPIRKIEDVKGMRIRTMSSPDELFWVELTGARPAPSTYPELYGMLKSGVFDGYDGNFTVHDSQKYYEVTKYITIMGYHYLVPIAIMSNKAWESLSPDEQKIFMDCAKQAAVENYPLSRRMVERAKKVALDNGGEILELEDIEKWREAVMPAYKRKMDESPAAKTFVEAVWAYHKLYPRWPTDLEIPLPPTK